MKVCDRCGKELGKKNSRNGLESALDAISEALRDLVKKPKPTVLVNASIRYDENGEWSDIELCEDCKQDFVKWVYEKKNGKEKNGNEQ